jgi:hypothetical protein
MTIPELLTQLEKLSDADLKKLIHAANVVLDARDEEQGREQCVEEMICQQCGQELDSEYGLSGQCPCPCHQLV